MIIIAGWLQVDRADRERYVADCVTVMRQARTSPGCLGFAITADPIESDRMPIRPRGSVTPRYGDIASPPR